MIRTRILKLRGYLREIPGYRRAGAILGTQLLSSVLGRQLYWEDGRGLLEPKDACKSYRDVQSSVLHPASSSFNESGGHPNPTSIPYQNHEEVAQKVTVGAFNLTPTLISRMDDFEPAPVNDQAAALPEALKARFKVHDGGYYLGAKPQSPQVGDVRISFAAVTPAGVTA